MFVEAPTSHQRVLPKTDTGITFVSAFFALLFQLLNRQRAPLQEGDTPLHCAAMMGHEGLSDEGLHLDS